MASWLYPVSGARGFLDARGKRRPTSFDDVREAVAERAFPKTAEWPCVQNGRNVRSGDELFLYTGDVGIFAAGRVIGAEPARSGHGWVISWQLDARRTRRLLSDPVPAEKVRKHVHPRVTVRDFNEGAKALRRSLA